MVWPWIRIISLSIISWFLLIMDICIHLVLHWVRIIHSMLWHLFPPIIVMLFKIVLSLTMKIHWIWFKLLKSIILKLFAASSHIINKFIIWIKIIITLQEWHKLIKNTGCKKIRITTHWHNNAIIMQWKT